MQVLPIEVKGLLSQPDNNIQVPFFVWDISDSGIGLWTSRPILAGSSAIVTISHPCTIECACRIVWCMVVGQDGYRMGLELLEANRKFRSLAEAIREEMQNVSEQAENQYNYKN